LWTSHAFALRAIFEHRSTLPRHCHDAALAGRLVTTLTVNVHTTAATSAATIRRLLSEFGCYRS